MKKITFLIVLIANSMLLSAQIFSEDFDDETINSFTYENWVAIDADGDGRYFEVFDADANWSRASDVRKKRNIHSQELGLDFINDLRTVRFQWKPSNEFPKEWQEYSEENNMNMDAVMHRRCITVGPEMMAAEAVHMLEEHKITSLLVADPNGRLVGAMNIHDLFRVGIM